MFRILLHRFSQMQSTKTHINLHGPHPGKTFLFSYGSNNPRQTAERLDVPYNELVKVTVACKAKDYVLAFGLFSQRWQGGVADMMKKQGSNCKGLAYLLDNSTIDKMDQYEGGYERKQVTLLHEGEHFKGIAYIQNKHHKDFHYPSRKYLIAIAKTHSYYYRFRNKHPKQIQLDVIDTVTGKHKGKEVIKKQEYDDTHHKQ